MLLLTIIFTILHAGVLYWLYQYGVLANNVNYTIPAIILLFILSALNLAILIASVNDSRRSGEGRSAVIFFILVIQIPATFITAYFGSSIYNEARGRAAIDSGKVGILVDGGIYLSGPIDTTSVNGVMDAISLKLNTVWLRTGGYLLIDSTGGLIEDAENLAAFISLNEIPVIIRNECSSACVLVALSSPHLSIEHGALIGFHQPNLISNSSLPLHLFTLDQLKVDFFNKLELLGVPTRVIEMAKQTPSNQMFYITGDELYRMGLAKELLPTSR